MQMDPEALRSAVAEGYSSEPPKNWTNLTPEQWAAADLSWVAEGAKMLATELNPEPGEWIVGQRVTRATMGDGIGTNEIEYFDEPPE